MGPAVKACPSNHECPSFRLEPYIWTYIFMLYFILSYMLGFCLSARYLCLFVGPSGLQAAGSIHPIFIQLSSLDTSVLLDIWSLVSTVMLWYYPSPLYVVILYILTILPESTRSEERGQLFDIGDYSTAWSKLHYFQTPAWWSRIYIMYCTLPKVLVQVH